MHELFFNLFLGLACGPQFLVKFHRISDTNNAGHESGDPQSDPQILIKGNSHERLSASHFTTARNLPLTLSRSQSGKLYDCLILESRGASELHTITGRVAGPLRENFWVAHPFVRKGGHTKLGRLLKNSDRGGGDRNCISKTSALNCESLRTADFLSLGLRRREGFHS